MAVTRKIGMGEADVQRYLEQLRWDGAPRCPHCLGDDSVYRCGQETADRIKMKLETRGAVAGYWKCGTCRKKFTVTVDTIMESTKIPLSSWIEAIATLCASPEGKSVNELRTGLQVSKRTAYLLFAKLACLAAAPKFREERSKLAKTQNIPKSLLRLGQSLVMENANGTLRTTKRLTFWPLAERQVLSLALRCGKPRLFPQR